MKVNSSARSLPRRSQCSDERPGILPVGDQGLRLRRYLANNSPLTHPIRYLALFAVTLMGVNPCSAVDSSLTIEGKGG